MDRRACGGDGVVDLDQACGGVDDPDLLRQGCGAVVEGVKVIDRDQIETLRRGGRGGLRRENLDEDLLGLQVPAT
jgi:hypothetical protein